MAKEPALCFLGGRFYETSEIQFSDSSANGRIEFSILVPGFKLAYMSVGVTERAWGAEVMSLRSHCHRPTHIFALSDNKPIVLPDKASVCTVMGIKQGISHREIG